MSVYVLDEGCALPRSELGDVTELLQVDDGLAGEEGGGERVLRDAVLRHPLQRCLQLLDLLFKRLLLNTATKGQFHVLWCH